VIHAAGIELGRTAEVEDVRSSVRASLELAAGLGLRTIAFPAVGAGIGGLALQRSAEVSIEVARAHLEGATSLEEVRFVLLGEPAFRVFEMVNDAAKVAEQMVRLEKRR
jgi:O-acetyl-ADP-ribose deacetylase (regulator of RNase III)